MDPCVTCGTTEETTSVCTCDCQCLETARQSGCREIKLIAPTRDTATAWTENDPIVPEGVFFLVKDRLFEGSLEYAIGDGESKYSELSMLYAGAPLSRTGAENHSPLAASGKSTLDPSWLPAATNSALGAVMTSTTGAAGKVPITGGGSTTLDSSWLPVSTSGAANKIPIAGNSGTLDSSWLPDATSSSKGAVKASTTTAADCVVKADSSGGLDGWKDAIIDAITADDGSGGLVTDSNGNLSVDFSQMPTDKFEALLKSLKMLIPLTANMDLYVDKNHASAGDTIVDGRGTQNMPFKTIQAAVNFVTETYSVGRYVVRIKVSNATYTECVSLPNYSRTSGYITVESLNYGNPATVTNSSGTASVFVVVGGVWQLRRLNINGIFATGSDANPHEPCCVGSNDTATVTIYGCALSAECTSYDGRLVIYVLHANGGKITIQNMADYQTSISCTRNGAPLVVLSAARGGSLILAAGPIAGQTTSYVIPCSGTMSVFAKAFRNAEINYELIGSNPLSFSGTMTGQKYQITNASSITAKVEFPGDSAGTVESETYCWFKDAS